MVAPYPAAAGLRRRVARLEANGQVFPEDNTVTNNNTTNNNNATNNTATNNPTRRRPPPQQQQNHHTHTQQPPEQPPRLSNVYCLLSFLVALLAVVTTSSKRGEVGSSSSSVGTGATALMPSQGDTLSLSSSSSSSSTSLAAAAVEKSSSLTSSTTSSTSSSSSHTHTGSNSHSMHTNTANHHDNKKNDKQQQRDFLIPPSDIATTTPTTNWWKHLQQLLGGPSPHLKEAQVEPPPKEEPLHFWKRLLFHKDPSQHHPQDTVAVKTSQTLLATLFEYTKSLIDPCILNPNESTLTDVIDKILTSTPRLLSMANLLLSITYLLHGKVAEWFLGGSQRQHYNYMDDASRRERLGGFLVFKLLLISAVVVPDTLDLLILLSWYTLLSFWRSLAQLCAATTAHTLQSGQPPHGGVLQLLVLILVCDALQAATCVALFYGAGWGMVILLTCDCLLLGMDVISHILRHVAQALEEGHNRRVGLLEDAQIALSTTTTRMTRRRTEGELNQEQSQEADDDAWNDESTRGIVTERNNTDTNAMPQDDDNNDNNDDDEARRRTELRRLDRRMEVAETAHARRLAILDTTVFGLQLFSSLVTVAHFLHIWTLHGLQFTLIDGVLALHLHSALHSLSKKIRERRNLNRIARDLDGLFDDASELDLRKASAAGDVCCICLVTMSTGNVKKVGCGHLYHTHCLREVVERARSMEAAKCPLCRSSVLDGRPLGNTTSLNGGNNNNNNGTNNQMLQDVMVEAEATGGGGQPQGQGERALFRFSTEHILPAWLPLPAFSFEVVRRPPAQPAAAPAAVADAADRAVEPPQQEGAGNGDGVVGEPAPEGDAQPPQQQSFLRRLLVLAGAIPMSPEEEARALDQLTDMFPQYDRADLLRELRERGSAEAVVEAVLMGLFSGVPRRGAVAGVVVPAAAENDEDGPEAAPQPEEDAMDDAIMEEPQ